MKFKEKSLVKFASLSLALIVGISNIGPFVSVANANKTEYEGEYLLTNGEYTIDKEYSVKVKVEVDNDRIIKVTDNGTVVGDMDSLFWRKAVNKYMPKYEGMEITRENYEQKIDEVDVVSTATASSNAIREAVKMALGKHFKSLDNSSEGSSAGQSGDSSSGGSTSGSEGEETTSEQKKIFDIIGAYFRYDRSFSHEVKVLENDDLTTDDGMQKIEKGIKGRVGFRSTKTELSDEEIEEIRKVGVEEKSILSEEDIEKLRKLEPKNRIKYLLDKFNKNYEISNIRIDFSTSKPMNSIKNAITYDLKLFDGTEINDIKITATVMKKLTDGYEGIYDKQTKKAYLKFGKEVKAGDYVSVKVSGAGLPKSFLRDFEVTSEDVKNGFISIQMPQVTERGKKVSRDIQDGDKIIFNVLLGENVLFEDIVSTVSDNVDIPVEKVEQKQPPKDSGFSGVIEAKHYMSKFDYFTRLRVTVEDGRITNVEDNNTSPKAGSVPYWAIGKESLNSVIGKSYSELNDDLITVSGATWSGHNIIDIAKKSLVAINEKNKPVPHIHSISLVQGTDINSDIEKEKIVNLIKQRTSLRMNKSRNEYTQEDRELLLRLAENMEIKNVRLNFSTDRAIDEIEDAITFDIELDEGTIFKDVKIDVSILAKLGEGYEIEYNPDEETVYFKLGKSAKAGDYMIFNSPRSLKRDLELTAEDIENGMVSIKLPKVIDRNTKQEVSMVKNGDKISISLYSDGKRTEAITSDVPTNSVVEKKSKKIDVSNSGFYGTKDTEHLISRFNYFAKLRVKVNNGRIASVEDNGTDFGEKNRKYWEPVVEKLDNFVGKSYDEINDDIVVVSGATWSRNAVVEAVKKAMVSLNSNKIVNKTSIIGVKGDESSSISLNPLDKSNNKIALDRIAGEDRYKTAIKVSESYFDKSENAILVSGEKEADALVSSSLAGVLNAPILLVEENNVPDEVKKELIRLGVKNIVIVGGDSSISKKVEKQLDNYNIEKISGSSRYETSEKVYNKVKSIKNTGKVILSSGVKTSDSLSAGSISALGTPILLTEKSVVPKNIRKIIDSNKNDELIIVGGHESISNKIKFNVNKSIRLHGKDRFETSKKIAEYSYPKSDIAVISNGDGVIADALVSSIVSAKEKSPILLTSSSRLPEVVKNALANYTKVKVVGGEKTVSDLQFK